MSSRVQRNLILKYTKEGDIVLDAFCGSGSTMVETKLLNKKIAKIEVLEFYKGNLGQKRYFIISFCIIFIEK